MSELQLRLLLLITGFTVVSGVFDALAFSYSSNVWQDGRLAWATAAKAAGSFFLGIVMYWCAVRYLAEAGIVTPELQTVVWFGVTILGVALLSGHCFHWPVLDQLIALNVLVSIGWLMSRSAAA